MVYLLKMVIFHGLPIKNGGSRGSSATAEVENEFRDPPSHSLAAARMDRQERGAPSCKAAFLAELFDIHKYYIIYTIYYILYIYTIYYILYILYNIYYILYIYILYIYIRIVNQ